MLLLLVPTIAIRQPLQKIHAFGIAKSQIVSGFLRDLVHFRQILANEALEIGHGLLKILNGVGLLKGGLDPLANFLLFEVLVLLGVVLLPQPLQNFVTLRKHLRHYNYRAHQINDRQSGKGVDFGVVEAQLLEHALVQLVGVARFVVGAGLVEAG